MSNDVPDFVGSNRLLRRALRTCVSEILPVGSLAAILSLPVLVDDVDVDVDDDADELEDELEESDMVIRNMPAIVNTTLKVNGN
jgi:hypothetical protein